MLRASTADENVMLTVMDERGAYVGKIAAGPAGYGLIFYYMQKPCATIKAEAAGHRFSKLKVFFWILCTFS